jgi:hypothetical protein
VHSDGRVALYDNLTDAIAGTNVGLVTLSATTGSGSDQRFIVVGTATQVTFDPTGTTNFIYIPSADQVNNLTAGIKEWTPNELLYGIGQGLLTNDVTDTVVELQPPDVVGAHVTLLTGGSVGQNSGTLEIPVVPGGSFTTAQLPALATAERTDIQFLGASPTSATVNFSGNIITLVGAGSWITDGFAKGDFISISGNTQNDTALAGALDQITDITANVLTLSTGLATETNKTISIAPVVTNPVFTGLPLANSATSESVQVNFIANGFDDTTAQAVGGQIVRTDTGSWITDGFQVGDLLQVTGTGNLIPPVHSNA